MSWLSQPARVATAGFFVLALAGCATLNVSSYLEGGADLNRYHTYNWSATDAVPTGDPRLDSNPFFEQRVRMDVDRQMRARGFEKVASGTPDLLVHYHASFSQEIDASAVDRQAGYSEDNERRPYVYEAGTLVLDLVDARTKRVVWRGWAEGSMDGLIDNQDWLEEKIDETVARILERLPRKL